ncbi:MAG: DUF1801 domain-containing protein [Chryseolinea sp.]
MKPKPLTVDEYISRFPEDIQFRLHKIRDTIRKTAPQAEELISYNQPLYKLNGMLISFAAWKAHIGLYPIPKATGEMKKKLEVYKDAKATLRFSIDKPLPTALIAQVVKLRMQENALKIKSKVKKRA